MAIPSAEGIAAKSGPDPVRDASKLVIEHPIPLHDPAWLKRLRTRCLWDGGTVTPRSDFCSSRCEERYAEWEDRTVHVLLGREPLQTFFEQGREVGG
ncbi:MAG: hypothetical protein OEM81_09445 [Acidimicrobiia bacterium]|nr:hypothetical protein [Acidimicrobiia bacterium]MDH3398040.1 hypothetical protein [Acidimicrobiia bacterium]